jgi:hypothetical protein
MQLRRYITLSLISAALLVGAHTDVFAQRVKPSVKQSREVLEAYRVVNRFNQLMAENLDFDRAFEATFPKDPARRRAIAIAEGEFGDLDLTGIDDATIVTAFKNEMQILFLTLLLFDEQKTALPARIEEIYSHGRARTIEEFRLHTDMLKQDVAELRNYLNKDPAAARRMQNFKLALTKPLEVPRNYVVKPSTYYSKGRVLSDKEEYYQIENYAVIREGSEMKIIGIRFFTLF